MFSATCFIFTSTFSCQETDAGSTGPVHCLYSENVLETDEKTEILDKNLKRTSGNRLLICFCLQVEKNEVILEAIS